MSRLNIFLIGEYSTGKSSVLNSFIGSIVSSSSKLRETSRVEKYTVRTYGDIDDVNANNMEMASKLSVTHKNNRAHFSGKCVNVGDINAVVDMKPYLTSNAKFRGIHVFDFPGLNDSSDTEGKYIGMIRHNIHSADLIIYVVDAWKPLTSTSDVANYNIICDMVKHEISVGHYVKMIVVSNKYDEHPDDKNDEDENELTDLQELHNTFTHMDCVTDCGIFRFSSHKYLIANMKFNDRNLYVPKFMIKEIEHILFNASIQLTPTIIQSLKSNDPGFIEPKMVKHNIAASEVSSTYGDWDNLFKFIMKENVDLGDNNKACLLDYLSKLIDSYTTGNFEDITYALITKLQSIAHVPDAIPIKEIIPIILNRLNKLEGCPNVKCKITSIEYNLKILVTIVLSMNIGSKSLLYEILLQHLENIISKPHVTNTSILIIMILANEFELTRRMTERIVKFISDQNLFKYNTKHAIWDYESKQWKYIDRMPTIFNDYDGSPMIHNLINMNCTINSELTRLLRISTMPPIILRIIMDEGKFDKEELIIARYLGDEALIRLKLIVYSNYDDSIGISYYNNELFKKTHPILSDMIRYMLHYK